LILDKPGQTTVKTGKIKIDIPTIFFLDRPSDPWDNPIMQTTLYNIPAENLERLTSKLDALIKRAAKLGCEIPTYTIGASFEKITQRREEANDFRFDGEENLDFTYEEVITYYPVMVSGSAPKIDGWQFAATCDYAESPVIIRALITDVKIPTYYRTCGAICEHCNLSRDRHECVILVHDDGRVIQVGKSCMRDFTGHKSPERLAEMAELLRDLDDDCRGFASGESMPDPSLANVLSWTSSVIGRLGWVSKANANDDIGKASTASAVMNTMFKYIECCKKREKFPFPLPSKLDQARADAAIAWVKSLTPSSDYEQNIVAVASRSGVSGRNWGIAVSIMAAYDRVMADRVKKDASEFVGTVGRKVNCTCTKKTCKCAPIKVTVTRCFALPDYGYGASYIHVMRDASNNALVWKTGSCLRTGFDYTLTGTVKEHEDHPKYGKQTILTRCRAEEYGHEDEILDRAAGLV
jgi:hypothetical protein